MFAACPICISFVETNDEETADEIAEQHDDNRHQGDDVTLVIDGSNESFRHFVTQVRELANDEQVRQLRNRMMKNEGLPVNVMASDFDEIWAKND